MSAHVLDNEQVDGSRNSPVGGGGGEGGGGGGVSAGGGGLLAATIPPYGLHVGAAEFGYWLHCIIAAF